MIILEVFVQSQDLTYNTLSKTFEVDRREKLTRDTTVYSNTQSKMDVFFGAEPWATEIPRRLWIRESVIVRVT